MARSALFILALLTAPRSSTIFAAQEPASPRLRIAVAVDDSATAGQFTSAFGAAFRSLGDVDVVTAHEGPQYILEGVVMCEPGDCRDASAYSLALQLVEPLSLTLLRAVLSHSLQMNPRLEATAAQADSLSARLWPVFGDYQRVHALWTVRWGRARYEQAVREFVQRIDTACFEKLRAANRVRSGAELQRHDDFVRSRTWIC